MTEEEAKVKWCPFVRVQDEREGYAAINRHPYAPKADQMCIASACMAWRWDEDAEFKSRAEAAYRRDGARLRPEHGFCGLAGAAP